MIGNKIQQLRKDNGMSQEDLALKLTISRQAISKWELGEATPDTENIVQLSKLFCVSTADVIWNNLVLGPITQEEADQIIALVDSMSTSRDWDWDLWVIIREGIDDFVSGRNSAEDTARIIQSRASIYMAEQN